MTLSAVDIIGLEAVKKLREHGFVVVHQVPTKSMVKAGVARKYPEFRSPLDEWHRMVATSIRIQNGESKEE